MIEFSSFLRELNKNLKKSNRLLTSTYITIDEGYSKDENYDLIHLFKACDFFMIYYVFYFRVGAKDILKDSTILGKYNYFDKFVNSAVDVSNVVFGISFNFRKYIIRDHKYYISDKMAYNDLCHLSYLKKCAKLFDTEIGLDTVRCFNETSREHSVFFYANSRSIVNQVRFAMKRHFAGILTSAISSDNTHSMCRLENDIWEDFKVSDGVVLNFPNRTNARFALLNSINEAIVLTLDEMRQELNIVNVSSSSSVASKVPFLLGCVVMFFIMFHTKIFIGTSLNVQWK